MQFGEHVDQHLADPSVQRWVVAERLRHLPPDDLPVASLKDVEVCAQYLRVAT